VDDSEDHETEISEVVKNNAWSILAWSFLASGVLAVITPTRSLTNIELETSI
jgi:aryl-alcohol dehydrogenase-like predicted oxidoreductase